MIDELAAPSPRHACLMINTLMDMAPQDTTVTARIEQHLARLRRAFLAALEHAVSVDRLQPAAPTSVLANVLICHTQGCTVLAKGGASHNELIATVPLVISSLGIQR